MSLINPQLQLLGAALVVKALRDLVPQAKFLKLRTTSIGFHCEFLFHKKPVDGFTEGFLEQLRERCRFLLTNNLHIKFHNMIPDNASSFLLHHQESLQSRLAKESERQFVTVLQVDDIFVFCEEMTFCQLSDIQGILLIDFNDIPSANQYKFGVAIQGAAFANSREQKAFQKKYEKHKKGNHISRGEKNQMLLFQEALAGPIVSWLPKGTAEIRKLWCKIEEEIICDGYETIITPTLIHESAFLKDGSLKNTLGKGSLEPVFIHGEPFLLRPSMVPAHIEIGREQMQRGKLPIRLAEFGKIYQSVFIDDIYGSVNNAEYLIDMQTIFCKREDGLREIISSLQLIMKIITMFDIPFRWVLSKQVKDKTGKRKGQNAQEWDLAVSLLQEALGELRCEFETKIIQTSQGLSGPRIEVRFTDSIEREWSGSFIEINLTLPRLFQSGFGKDYFEKMPMAIPMVMHRSLAGPVDRIISLKIENM